MSKSRPRNHAPDGLVIPKHRYKLDAKTRAAIAIAAKTPLAAKPRRVAKKTRRPKAKGRRG